MRIKSVKQRKRLKRELPGQSFTHKEPKEYLPLGSMIFLKFTWSYLLILGQYSTHSPSLLKFLHAWNMLTMIAKQVIQIIQIILVGTNVCSSLLFLWVKKSVFYGLIIWSGLKTEVLFKTRRFSGLTRQSDLALPVHPAAHCKWQHWLCPVPKQRPSHDSLHTCFT